MYLLFDGYLIYSFGISNIYFYFLVKIDDKCTVSQILNLFTKSHTRESLI